MLSYPQALIYSLDDGKPQVIDYAEASCVQTYASCMQRRDRILHELIPDSMHE